MSDSDPNKRGANLSTLSRISLFIDDNKQVITYGLYTLGFAGLIKIGLTLRAFERFKKITDIPEDFFTKQINIFGYVDNVQVSKLRSGNIPLLSISHIPIFSLPNSQPKSSLQVAVPGLIVHPQFVAETEDLLKILCLDNKVKVKLINREESYINGEIRMRRYGIWSQCLARRIVAEGFANPHTSPRVLTNAYMHQLNQAEATAKTNKKGMWVHHEEKKVGLLRRVVNWFKRKNS